ncbi:hypothetical protein K432DRAFT_442157 [Lepidopterella palustris CBS 459.81]|uniref:FAD-binding FR-type domain-containing protein n=1 Tax=Lepidopterella palustris CBS 459.81 TaxID=1314670 RepID=A0A8E2JH23_9PEZI|nr:hypothetical protein K432DRAFT_442157 [Lepidopterella palustris CBS 459.81]
MSQTRSATRTNLSHEERTASEHRDPDLHTVILDKIKPVNDRIRILRLAIKGQQRGIPFLPGQWLDVHVPGLRKAGGFTITSTPRDAVATDSPFLELAIQDSPSNPPAAWLWKREEEILGQELSVRVGGSFVWPPPGVNLHQIKRVVFIAGGVGINPLISILSHIRQTDVSLDHLRCLYMTKIPRHNPKASDVLFLPRLLDIFHPSATGLDTEGKQERERLELFFTGGPEGPFSFQDGRFFLSEHDSLSPGKELPHCTYFSRIGDDDLRSAAGYSRKERQASLYYVCGPPNMTDHVVDFMRKQDGVDADRVLCEKWW